MVSHPTDDPSDDRMAPDQVTLSRTRQAVLRRLEGRSTSISVSALATELVEYSEEPPIPDNQAGELLDRVEMRLHHIDLPLLDSLGMLQYDWQARLVTPINDLTSR